MVPAKNIWIATAAALTCVAAYYFIYKKEPMESNEVGGAAADNAPTGTIPHQKNFNIDEYKCHDGTPVPASLYGNVQKSMDSLQALRNAIGLPVIIVSGYRTPAHNKAVGGVPDSCHLKGMATDIKVPGMTPKQVHAKIEALIASGDMDQGGLGLYPTFVHYDVRGTKARWNG